MSLQDLDTDLAAGVDHQIAMVMDLNKCIGCQTCTVGCKTTWTESEGQEYQYWNNVETRPGQGYPKDWEEKGGGWESANRSSVKDGDIPAKEEYGEAWEFDFEAAVSKPDTETLQPKGEDPEWGPNWDEDQGAGEYPNSHYFYLPRICNHCTHPTCVEACPRQAIYKRAEDGVVLVDQERCRGYRYCVEGCPYKKVYYNAAKKTSEKCIFCYPRLEGEGPDGEVHGPVCATECPTQLRLVGYLDDQDGPIYKLVEQYEVAIPLHPEYETAPNIFYIPPFDAPPQIDEMGETTDIDRIPEEYLEDLFGDRVHQARETLQREREKVNRGGSSEVMEILTSNNPAQQYRLEVFDS
ncbi:4Fe-4S dicluster domain-containing protein [Halodesulfurarchaeum sp.]|uniref:nitrate reductase subunit beta n=1 Tax=Halodesulfurarchaeum sp. TaxID=1980530 RepID=UPI002FC3C4DA